MSRGVICWTMMEDRLRRKVREIVEEAWEEAGTEVTLHALADVLEERQMPHLGELIRRLAREAADEEDES